MNSASMAVAKLNVLTLDVRVMNTVPVRGFAPVHGGGGGGEGYVLSWDSGEAASWDSGESIDITMS